MQNEIDNDISEATFDKTKPIVKEFIDLVKETNDYIKLRIPNSLKYDHIAVIKLYEDKDKEWTRYRINCYEYEYNQFGKNTKFPITCYYAKVYSGTDKAKKGEITFLP